MALHFQRTVLKIDGFETVARPDGRIEITEVYGLIPAVMNSSNFERKIAWRHSSRKVLEHIASGSFYYYFSVNGRHQYLEVCQAPDGTSFLPADSRLLAAAIAPGTPERLRPT